jgi:N-carbamoylputrescine amidase
MPDKFTIGLVQMKCTSNADENLSRATDKIREAAARGAQIICLHELFRSEYFCRKEDAALFDLAEAIPGPATEALAKVAKERKIVLVASLFERRAAGVYHNTCAVLDADGSFLGKYRKMHIPDDPLYYEKFYFTPGDLSRLPKFQHQVRQNRRTDLLGPMVSGGLPPHRVKWRAGHFLSDQHRLAS